MLTGRNVLVSAICIAAISLLSVTWPQSSESRFKLGRNSYGVHYQGHRGLFETLDALKFPVQRHAQPPNVVSEGQSLAGQATFVFLEPDRDMVQVEPTYLADVASWVRAGGNVFYCPAVSQSVFSPITKSERNELPPKTFLQLMGIDDDRPVHWQVESSDGNDPVEIARYSNAKMESRYAGQSRFAATVQPTKGASIAVQCDGQWASLSASVLKVYLPEESLWLYKTLPTEGGDPLARVVVPTADGQSLVLAAMYRLGKGKLILLSDPALAQNGFLSHDDNSVLLVNWLSAQGGPIIFDEFYHRLTPRGNPLVLLRRPLFTVLITMICLSVGVYAWRHSVRLGPAISSASVQRRSLLEYVEAMSRLFSKSRGRVPFLLKESRRGLVWSLQNDLGLTGTKNAEQNIVRILKHRDSDRAEQFEDCLRQLDRLLQDQHVTDREAINSIRKVSDCL